MKQVFQSARIAAPANVIAARIRRAIDEHRGAWPEVMDPHGPHGALYEIFLTALDDAKYERRRRNDDWRVDPPSYRLVSLIVDDKGSYRVVEITQHHDAGAPIVRWLADLICGLWPEAAPASSAAGDDQVMTAGGGAGAGDDQVGLTEGEKEWYQTLLTCKTAFGNKEMTWSQIGDRHGVSGRTAKRRLQDLQGRGLPGLDDWPDREN